MIALSIDNQWTVEWHTWLPYKTNQFYVQHDFLFFSAQTISNCCRKMLSKKIIFIKYKNKNMYAKIRVAFGVCFSIFALFVINFSRLKDVFYLKYKGLYFSIMYKTHLDIETWANKSAHNIYDNLLPQITTTAPLLSVSTLSRQSPRLKTCFP